jgi:hypothetical protein
VGVNAWALVEWACQGVTECRCVLYEFEGL